MPRIPSPTPAAPSPPSPASAAALVRQWWPEPARLAVILGSGFDGLRDQLAEVTTLPCARLPHIPVPAVHGHAGEWIWGRLGNIPLLLLSGRVHFYEGYTLQQITQPVRVLAGLGVGSLLLTNAAGGIRRTLKPGSFMLIRDHINAMGANPLTGPVPRGRERFIDMSEVYSPELRSLMKQAARRLGIPLKEGVYVAVPGPSYETPAEIRAMARLGADAIGMSSVPEAIVARQHGMAVAGLSCITNPAAGLEKTSLSHKEVLMTGKKVTGLAGQLLAEFVKAWAKKNG